MKFPLSTVDTYSGFSGSSVFMLYQLYKCPFHFTKLFIVLITFLIISNALSNVIIFKSYAEIIDNISNPIFVEEVLITNSFFLPN